tara:strand:- start:363 stop:530 length:168 start_codon:yes stop_codon:yes gene_type:complete
MRLTKKSNINKLTINQFKSYKKIARDRSRGIITYNEFKKKLDLLLIKWNLENGRK